MPLSLCVSMVEESSHENRGIGPLAAHYYHLNVRAVTETLVAVGRGMSHTEAGRRARDTAGLGPRSDFSLSQMVGNWVEVFSPVVAVPHAEREWPETVVLDSVNLQGRWPSATRKTPLY